MINQLLVASLVVRSAVSQNQWVTVFQCDGDGKTDNRWNRDFGRRGWDRVNGMTLEEFAKTATKLRICTTGDYDDCVTTKEDNIALKNLINGEKNIQPQGWDKLTHGLYCDKDCVNEYWEGPSKRLKQLEWNCGTSQDEMLFHACGNNGGLHISMDKGHCEWDWESSDRLEMQLLVPSEWVTVFTCLGDHETPDRVVYDDWQELAQRSSVVRICTRGSDLDCVESSGIALTNLRNGVKFMQKQKLNFCDVDCVKKEWSGPDERLEQMSWNCAPWQWKMFYHACGNAGLHIGTTHNDEGHCEWEWNDSDKIEIQLLADLPTPSPTASPTPPPSSSPTTAKPTTAEPTSLPTTEQPTSAPTKTPTSGPTVEPMRFEEYKALCALSAESKDTCKGLGCRFKNAKRAKCIAKSGKKTKCWKILDLDVCLRLGCGHHKDRGCLGKPVNLLED